MTVPGPWRRLVRFVAPDGRTLCGEPVDHEVDVGLALAQGERVAVKVANAPSVLDATSTTGEITTIDKLLTPLAMQEVGTIRCIGLNFKDHAAELKMPLPKTPEVFLKPAQSLADPFAPIVLPRDAPSAVDAEVEFAIVIGKDCKDVSAVDAIDYVLGYTIANDVTCRDVQASISQWGYAKGFDGFCPLGPTLVAAREFGDVSKGLRMKTMLNGVTLQDGTTAEMIFEVPELVEYLSKGSTLPKGTVILTGTPSGIGHSYSPPRYMTAGCDLRISIEGLGTLINSVVASKQQKL